MSKAFSPILILLAIAIFFIPLAHAEVVYQETANQTAFGGSAWDSPGNLDDGIWTTQGFCSDYNGNLCYFYENYTKPIGATNATSIMKFRANIPDPNVTQPVPTSCWNADPVTLQVRMVSDDFGPSHPDYGSNYALLQCLNNTGWQDLQISTPSPAITEDGIFWEIPPIIAAKPSDIDPANLQQYYQFNPSTGGQDDGLQSINESYGGLVTFTNETIANRQMQTVWFSTSDYYTGGSMEASFTGTPWYVGKTAVSMCAWEYHNSTWAGWTTNWNAYSGYEGAGGETGMTLMTYSSGTGSGPIAWVSLDTNETGGYPGNWQQIFTTDVLQDQWVHTCTIYDGSMLKYYRNGILMNQTAVTGSLTQPGSMMFRISKAYEGQFKVGGVAELAVWDKALNETQVGQLAGTIQTPPTPPAPSFYYNVEILANTTANNAILYKSFNDEIRFEVNFITDASFVNPDVLIYKNGNLDLELGIASSYPSNTTYLTQTFNGGYTNQFVVSNFNPNGFAWDVANYTMQFAMNDVNNTFYYNSTQINFTILDSPPDTTPPAAITDLTNTTATNESITWTWTNPADSDFNHTQVFCLPSCGSANVYAPTATHTFSGLTPDTNYTIRVWTVDNTGNVNDTVNVENTATTLANPAPPAPSPAVAEYSWYPLAGNSLDYGRAGNNLAPDANVIYNTTDSKVGSSSAHYLTSMGALMNLSLATSWSNSQNHDSSFFAWVKYGEAPTSQPIFYGDTVFDGNRDTATWNFRYDSGTGIGLNTYSNTYLVSYTPPVGEWIHIGYTYNSTTKNMTIYVNGTEIGSFWAQYTLNTVGDAIVLGAYYDGNALVADQKFNDARFYNNTLSPHQVSLIYNNGLGSNESLSVLENMTPPYVRTTGPSPAQTDTDKITHYWSMQQTTGDAIDSGSHPNTLVNNGVSFINETFNTSSEVYAAIRARSESDYLRNFSSSLDDGFNGATQFSVFLKVRYNSTAVATDYMFIEPAASVGDGYLDLISGDYGAGVDLRWRVTMSNNCPGVCNNVDHVIANLNQINDDQWHSSAITFDGTNMLFYFDGSIIENTTAYTGATLGPGALNGAYGTELSGHDAGTYNNVEADVKQVAFWQNHSLLPYQIQNMSINDAPYTPPTPPAIPCENSTIPGATEYMWYRGDNAACDAGTAGNNLPETSGTPTLDTANAKVYNASFQSSDAASCFYSNNATPSFSGNEDMSACYWIRPSTTMGSGDFVVASMTTFNGASEGLWVGAENSQMGFFTYSDNVLQAATFAANVWEHNCFSYNSTTKAITFYQDGNNLGTQALSGTPSWNEPKVVLGGYYDGSMCAASGFVGQYEDVRIYQKAISSGEVGFIYNGSAGTQASLSQYTPPTPPSLIHYNNQTGLCVDGPIHYDAVNPPIGVKVHFNESIRLWNVTATTEAGSGTPDTLLISDSVGNILINQSYTPGEYRADITSTFWFQADTDYYIENMGNYDSCYQNGLSYVNIPVTEGGITANWSWRANGYPIPAMDSANAAFGGFKGIIFTRCSENVSLCPAPPVDTTPPASVTNLVSTGQTNESISWSWTNPADPDFNHVIIYLDAANVANTTGTTYTANGLTPNSTYMITLHTVDTTGNVNATDVSETNRTLETTTPPPCTPDWTCNGYASCGFDDNRSCNSVADLNTCGDSYTGNYSEFTPQSCNYCTSTYSNTTSACVGGFQNNTYVYTNTCCYDTGLPSDCNIPTNTTSACIITPGYQANYEATDVPNAVGEGVSKTVIATAGFAGAITLVGIIRLAMLLI
jgi:hypothetical protein